VETISCQYRLVGSKEWKPVQKLHVDNEEPGASIINCYPLANTRVALDIEVEDKTKNGRRWFYRSWVARFQPIRFKVTLETITGATFSKVIEYIQAPSKLETQDSSTALFLYADNPSEQERYIAKLSETLGDNHSVTVFGYGHDDTKLRKLVYQAMQSGDTEQLLTTETKDEYEAKAWALIDLNCKRVYAVKVMIVTKPAISAQLGYHKVALYGDVSETKPNKPAVEKEKFPDIETPKEDCGGVQDDDYDDKVQVVESTSTGTTGSTGSTVVGGGSVDLGPLNLTLVEMNQSLKTMATSMEKLNKIDANLDRIANSFDLLVGIMKRTNTK